MRIIRRRNWFIKRVALGLAVAAVAAPVAQAKGGDQPWPAVNPYDVSVTSVKAPDYHGLRATPHALALAWANSASAANTDKSRGLGGALAREDTQVSPSVVASILGEEPSATGFNWDDGAIGGGFVLALVLLGGGAVLASRHVSRAQTA